MINVGDNAWVSVFSTLTCYVKLNFRSIIYFFLFISIYLYAITFDHWTKVLFLGQRLLSIIPVAKRIGKVTSEINAFLSTGLFLYRLKKSENQRFSDVFRGYIKRPLERNGLGKNI